MFGLCVKPSIFSFTLVLSLKLIDILNSKLSLHNYGWVKIEEHKNHNFNSLKSKVIALPLLVSVEFWLYNISDSETP